MNKLSKEQKQQKQALATKIENALANLEQAIQEANEFIEDVHTSMEEFYDERSQRWQESEAGSAYEDWISEWGTEIDANDEPLENFQNLPDAPEG